MVKIKVKIPQKIKIGGHWVSIFYEDKLMDNHSKMGQARFPECEIAIQERDASESRKTASLLHELVHWLDHTYNNFQLDEVKTDALANGIHTLLIDMGIQFDWSDIKE